MGHQGTPELELLAAVIVLFTPTLHETLTNSNFDTNTICKLSHGSSTAVNSSQFLSENNYTRHEHEAIQLPKTENNIGTPENETSKVLAKHTMILCVCVCMHVCC